MNRLMRRRAKSTESTFSILAEARVLGATFGLRMFGEATTALAAEIDENPASALDVPWVLARFKLAAHAITLASGSEAPINDVGLAHWQSANAALGSEIVRLVGDMLTTAAERLDAWDEFEDWSEGIGDLVIAVVLPHSVEDPKDGVWVEERLAVYAGIRERLGLTEERAPAQAVPVPPDLPAG